EEELAELAASIKENGLLQPIVVRPAGNRRGTDRWELVAGERRWRAVTRLGWTDVPALVRDVDDRTLLVLALVENLQRSGLG
ncbi:MAG: ParB/RepB/Spo0J family partition protein, partial [Gemmatimonadetes bacterium]|nr:ParB/RepB/Spo0J family partition protein [Gemmatimonadota bacterium]NIU72876.1 ParB/RepB/Spo0J family partition protein [Gammaproteobacteria bacterium]NIR42905.1 ParB/RepB/Spo0J family partition protein [Gemmatimonadota bacterium]NIS01682.1 ParB/RepB/Spo0J family partition protein [Gemmatimonadota bacterium]NIV22457.1 ParB/RepB/Spo0J family partition protein [Gemmatimonadota bacterium]